MAIIKAVNSKASIAKAINYVTKEEKTEEKLISGKDCNPYAAIDEMKATKEQWKKTEGRQYTHLVQSFNPEDNVTPEQAHKIGKEFIENSEKFKGHEVVIATHTDKGHIHNHFIINSVNFENGKKLHTSKKDLQHLKEYSNELSKEHNLSVPTKGHEITSFNQKKYRAIEKGLQNRQGDNEKEKSYLVDTAKQVQTSLSTATSKEEFIKNMENKGYKVNWTDTRKYITFTPPKGRPIRNSNLEETFKEKRFNKEEMKNEIQRNREHARGTETDRTSTETTGRGTEHSTDKQGIRGPIEGNKRTQQADAELHKGSHERGFSNSNDSRQRVEQSQDSQSRDTTENGIDIAKARKLAEELRRKSSSSFGKWQDGNEQQQQNDIDEDERDRGNAEPKHERNERGGRSRTERIREQDFELDL